MAKNTVILFFVIASLSGIEGLLSNVSRRYDFYDLPIIYEGAKCHPGRLYRSSCNTCKCTFENGLVCTKMACLQDEEYSLRTSKDNLHDYKRTLVHHHLPKDKCDPGKLYQKGCQRCFCNEKGHPVCTSSERICKDIMKMKSIETPEDVRPKFTQEETNALPILPNAASKCAPGRAYKVDCNSCLCLANGNLLCDKKLCLSYEDINRVKAQTVSGSSCKKLNRINRDKTCIDCKCVKEKLQCEAIPDCVPVFTRKALHGELKPTLELGEDANKCQPMTIYKNNCNKCYCQPDGSLRCTLKTCLNYQQVQKLKKTRLYLEKHGL